MTHDTGFEKSANKVWDLSNGPGAEVSLKDFRKDIIIDLFNEAGQKVISYRVYRCWVSEYQALPDLDANAGAVAINISSWRMKAGTRSGCGSNPASLRLPCRLITLMNHTTEATVMLPNGYWQRGIFCREARVRAVGNAMKL